MNASSGEVIKSGYLKDWGTTVERIIDSAVKNRQS